MRKLLTFLIALGAIVFAVVSPVATQVSLDAASTGFVFCNAATTCNFTNLTVGSGANRVLVAFLSFGSPSIAASITYNRDTAGANQPMTLIGAAQDITARTRAELLFGLVNPVSGNKTLNFNWTGGTTA